MTGEVTGGIFQPASAFDDKKAIVNFSTFLVYQSHVSYFVSQMGLFSAFGATTAHSASV